jgi:magnesium and cobalt transporter
VLEQIVGDIADEHDFDHDDENIIAETAARHRVKASTSVEDFNAHFASEYSDEDFDTIGGLVTHAFGRVPKRNETVAIGDWQFTVSRADSRRIVALTVQRAGTRPT